MRTTAYDSVCVAAKSREDGLQREGGSLNLLDLLKFCAIGNSKVDNKYRLCVYIHGYLGTFVRVVVYQLSSSSVKSSGSERKSPFLRLRLTAIKHPSVRFGIFAKSEICIQVKFVADPYTKQSHFSAKQPWMFDEEEANGPDIMNTTRYPKSSTQAL
jgi:hypothetical protein